MHLTVTASTREDAARFGEERGYGRCYFGGVVAIGSYLVPRFCYEGKRTIEAFYLPDAAGVWKQLYLRAGHNSKQTKETLQ